jgi:hypothetical protein
MLLRLQNALFVVTLGTIGADRIDFFGGAGPFRLTPFLVFCTLYVGLSIVEAVLSGGIRLALSPALARQKPFAILLALLIGCIAISILFGADPVHGLTQFADLSIQILFTFLLGVQILNSPDRGKLISRAVLLALVIYAGFCLAEYRLYQFSLDSLVDTDTAPKGFVYLVAGPFGPWLARLCGPTIDPNRAGFVLVMYMALIDLFTTASARQVRWIRILVHVFVVMTISNTAVLCLFFYDLFWWDFRAFFTSSRRILKALSVAAVLCLIALVFHGRIETLLTDWNISDILSAKSNVTSGSSGAIHVALLERSVDVWLSSAKTFFIGIGMGGDYTVLYDIFGPNKDANFHSLYGMFLADFGIISFLILMLILIPPIFLRRRAAGCMLGIMVFNISYLTLLEPVMWLMLWMLWSLGSASWRPKLSASQALAAES